MCIKLGLEGTSTGMFAVQQDASCSTMDPKTMLACVGTQAKRQAPKGVTIIAGAAAATQCMHSVYACSVCLQSPCNIQQPLSCSLPSSQCFVINQLVWGVYLILQPFRRQTVRHPAGNGGKAAVGTICSQV